MKTLEKHGLQKENLKRPMNKQANMVTNTLLGGGAGAGLYSLLRALRDAKLSKKEEDEERPDELVITLPSRELPKVAADNEMSSGARGAQMLLDAVMPVVGGVGGFVGAKELYGAMKKRKLKKEEEELEAQYLSKLQELSKYATCKKVDEVCSHIAANLQKTAMNWPLLETLDPAFDKVNVGYPEKAVANAAKKTKSLLEDGTDDLMPYAAAILMTGLLGGFGGATVLRNMKKDKSKEEKKHRTLPTRVRLKVLDSGGVENV